MICQAACFETIVPSCPDLIVLNVGLEAATPYRWEITTRHNITYNGSVTTDATGLLGIDIAASELPAGLLNEFAGACELKVWKILSPVSVEAATFTIGDVDFECISLQFKKYNPQITYVDVDAPVYVPPSGSAPVEVPFINQTVVVVAHNLGYHPLIQVLDNTDTILEATVQHDSVDQFTVTMVTPQTGHIIYR